jgi:hypothetical protein
MQSLQGPTLPKTHPAPKPPAPLAAKLSPQAKAATARALAEGLRTFAPETNDLMEPWMLLQAQELDRWAAEMDEYANFMLSGFEPESRGWAKTRNPFNPLPNPLETRRAALVGSGL